MTYTDLQSKASILELDYTGAAERTPSPMRSRALDSSTTRTFWTRRGLTPGG
ncbi:MAG: hypothetical protein LBU32_27540 [Clostridiales bacterium]|nr:hypothetical protein [Clostridiales bacterium]